MMFNPQMWLWSYRYRDLAGDSPNGEPPEEAPAAGWSIKGFSVEALDGSIGHVDEVVREDGHGRIVVGTGPWIFGTKVVLPAGVIDQVDAVAETVYVHRTKDEIKSAPRLADEGDRELYLQQLGSYYGEGGAGFRTSDERLRPWS